MFNSICSVSLESVRELAEVSVIEDWIEKTGNIGGRNLIDLVQAKTFVKLNEAEETKVYYFCPPELPKLKYIILSATLNVEIYKRYFQDSILIQIYSEKKEKYKGKLIQYTYHSLGRGHLKKKMEVF